METTRNWLLPALLAAAQIAWVWPVADLAGAEVPGAAALVAVLGAVVVETVALGRRRQAPVLALAWSLGSLLVGQLAWQDGYLGMGAPIALFSVAVRCAVPVTVRAVAAAVGVEWLLSLVQVGVRPALASDLVLGALVYVVCVGLGEARRQWLKGRLLATRRLAGAEETRRRAGDTERRRLARELHDVSAHHLTSVVITADAARRLGGSRPELTAEALSFAERTGTETLTALQRLVGLLRDVDRPDPRPMTARIEELIAGFGRLGRPIDAVLPADLAGPAAEAVHGIVREALTNALRYAPGSAAHVSVLRGEGVLELSVDNAPPRGSAPDGVGGVDGVDGLGSGRGVAGMRERAAAVGGELTAGPAPGGGWRVRATLPDVTGPWGPPEGVGRRDVLREQRLADPALVCTATLLPLVFVLVTAEEWTGASLRAAVPGLLVVTVLLTAHAVPLLWRRRAPWPAFLGVLATSWLWPVVVAWAALPSRVFEFLAGGALVELLAVYAVAVYGRGAARTWPAWCAAAVSLSGTLVATAGTDGELLGEDSIWPTALVMFVPLAMVLAAVLAGLWGAGLAVRRRRLRTLAWDDYALAGTLWHAERAADAERHRLASRLRDAVLHPTAALVEQARQGRLEEVAAGARSALAAMRELLHSLGESEDSEYPGRGLAPAPTAADLDTLCRTMRATGRDVMLRGLPEAARDLPPAVALSAYRIVEAALGAGDRGPARVTLTRRRATLRVTVSGVPLAVTGPVAERLQVQVGTRTTGIGRITLEQAGTVRVLLSTRPSPAPVQEVSPSPYA
ncbi:histidine kinase [Streptomyces sp. NBC_00576]|uniref:histidine kinase n=1 Tax=Streptomyces sp. NBC_00576 TaxID=2903665 RepID=UPI002E80AB56|nr:histidine kinase [Streptomyces sp. NBC_00576]WUB73089.1 histidine kinase [Streptomyces sp. NBC_00576]